MTTAITPQKTLTVYLYPELRDRIRERADAEDRTLGAVIRRAVTQYLADDEQEQPALSNTPASKDLYGGGVAKPVVRCAPEPCDFSPPRVKRRELWGVGMTPDEFRTSMAWRRARERARKNATYCAICSKPLVPNARPRTKWATSVDHVHPLASIDLSTAEGRAFAVNQDYLRAVHFGCNARRGALWRARNVPHGSARRRADADGWLGGRSKRPLGYPTPEVHNLAEIGARLSDDPDRDLSADIPPPSTYVGAPDQSIELGVGAFLERIARWALWL